MNGPFWLELMVRSAVLLLAGEALRWLSRRRGPAFRHALLLCAFALLALLPVLSLVCPEIRIPLSKPARVPTAMVTVHEVSSRVIDEPSRPATNWPLGVWLLGVALASAPLIFGGIAVRKMAKRAAPLTTPALRQALQELPPELTRKAEIRVSGELRVPLTCGIVRSRILLPSAAEHWTSSRLRAVVAHELAHARRRDVAAQMAAHVVAALWWFQPLVWVLRRGLRVESEFACDAEAVRAGFRPSEYARELLTVAQAVGSDARLSSAAISMTRTGDLEKRVRAILHPPTALLGRGRVYAVLAALASVAVCAAAVTVSPDQSLNEQGGSIMKRTIMAALLASAGLSAATISGTISDTSGAALADVRVLLTNPDTGAKQEATTAADGRFALEANSAGNYILRLEKPGYVSIFREFDVKADSKVDRGFTMSNEGGGQVADKVADANEEQSKTFRIGGRIAEANLTTKVQPIYPPSAKADGVQGTVEIEAVISKDGVPTELRVLRSPGDDLSESALEAVRQWRYRPTLLNGEPVGIVTDIIVNYTLSR